MRLLEYGHRSLSSSFQCLYKTRSNQSSTNEQCASYQNIGVESVLMELSWLKFYVIVGIKWLSITWARAKMAARSVTLSLLLCVLCCGSRSAPLPNATYRATQVLEGLLAYYWRSAANAERAKFFFSCGQVGGEGNRTDLQHCYCLAPMSCTNCYRWWDAVAMEAIVNYGIYTKTRLKSGLIKEIFAHSPYNSDYDPTKACTYIDDFAWYGMAYLRTYEWLKVSVHVVFVTHLVRRCGDILYLCYKLL